MARKQSKAVISRHFFSAPNQITSVVALVFAKNRQRRQKRHAKSAGGEGVLRRAAGRAQNGAGAAIAGVSRVFGSCYRGGHALCSRRYSGAVCSF